MLLSLFFNYEIQEQRKGGTHYGVAFDTMTWMVSTKYFSSFIMLSNPTLGILFSTMEKV
jgi:hypothetical protein